MPNYARPPLERGFMRRGMFAWPAAKVVCPGYIAHAVSHTCGIVFETYSGHPDKRCQKCRAAHKREWFRLRSIRRRLKTRGEK